MRALGVAQSSLVVLASLAGCRPTPEPTQAAAAPVVLPEAPARPEHGLPVVDVPAQWAPPRTIAGDLEGLQQALASATDVVAAVEPRLASGQGSLRAVLEQLGPRASWTVASRSWDASVAPGVLPLTREDGTSGPPRYAATGVRAQTVPAQTLVVIADAPIDLRTWRALPAAWSGSCDPAFEALALSQEQSLAYAEPFLDHVDTVLRLRFREALARALPTLGEETAPFAAAEPPAGASPAQAEAHACGHASYLRVQAAAACLHEDVCALGPRMVLRGGAAVAMPAPPWSPEDCGELLEGSVEAALQGAATEATVATLATLEPRWVTLADRIGALGAVYEALEDLCSPRRRRFAAEDLEDARVRLARVPRALGSEVLDEGGRWDVGSMPSFVPGTGPMLALARFVPADGGASQSAVAEAKGVRRFLLSRSLCRSGYGELPLAVAVFEPGRTDASYFGYLYEESLLCSDLALPAEGRWAPAPAPAAER